MKNANAGLPYEVLVDCNILIEDGFIKEISNKDLNADEIIELNNNNLISGFIDIHNHGAVGFDVNESDANDLIEIAKFLAERGVIH